jgi:hypothetical protein
MVGHLNPGARSEEMCKRGLTRREVSAGAVVLALITSLAVVVTPASARHGCHARCRQLSSGGSGGGSGGGGGGRPVRRMALLRHRVHRHDHFMDVKLRCLRHHRACRGVLQLEGRSSKAPELARVRLDVPARRTRAIVVRLSRPGLAYLKDHESVRAILALDYPRNRSDSFTMTILG